MTNSQALKIAGISSLLASLVALTCTNLHDLDHGFYLAVGRHMIATSAIPRNEFYLPLLANQPFASPWLLSALLIAFIWKQAGVAGLIVLKALCYTGAFALAAHAARRRGVPVTIACAIAAIAACAVATRLVERPGFFSALFYGIIIAWIPPRGKPSRPSIAAMIAMLVLWPFLHAEWYIGLFLFACLTLTIERTTGEKILTIALAAALPCVTFAAIHPAHAAPLVAPFRFILGAGPDFQISEYRAETWTQLWGAIPLLLLVAIIAAWLAKQRRFPEAMLLFALVALSAIASRAALPALLIATPWIAQAVHAAISRAGRQQALITTLLVAVGPLWACAWLALSPQRNLGFQIDPMIDTRGIGRIFDQVGSVEGTVLAEYGYTSQLLANESVVRQGVVMDGRQEAYSEDYLQATYLNCVFLRGAAQQAALKNARVAFYAESWREAGGTDLFPALHQQGWDIIGWDNSGRVLARPGIAAKYNLQVYNVDPANINRLRGSAPGVIRAVLSDIREQNNELDAAGLPNSIPLCAQAALELSINDIPAAEQSLEESRAGGGERISSYWKTKLSLATIKDDVAGMKHVIGEMKKRGFMEE
ncbi:hypothetical protein IT570_10860 [Candidatus Sumerlaeota bacterium]|nr:hypothetical protein [Candidatus Sumerlaeota bacterium]